MFVSPQEILNQIELKKDAKAADLGAGSGGWTLPLAKKLDKGRVLAVDLQEEPLSALAGEAKAQGLRNISFIVADVENAIPGIADESCDFVLATNLLFQLENPADFFNEVSRILKPAGQFLLVDWKPGTGVGPQGARVAKEQAQEMAQARGFKLKRELNAQAMHYGLLFEK